MRFCKAKPNWLVTTSQYAECDPLIIKRESSNKWPQYHADIILGIGSRGCS